MRFGLGVGLTVFVGLTSAVSVSKREAGQGTEELVFKHITSPVSHTANVDACNGYSMSDVSTSDHGLTATLRLIGEPCNAYGNDIETLTLKVGYETEDRLHVTIADAEGKQYQVPEDVVQRPKHSRVEKEKAKLRFEFQEQPFSFRVLRVEDEEVLFDTQDSKLIFEDQYLHLATKVPEDANLYGELALSRARVKYCAHHFLNLQRVGSTQRCVQTRDEQLYSYSLEQRCVWHPAGLECLW